MNGHLVSLWIVAEKMATKKSGYNTAFDVTILFVSKRKKLVTFWTTETNFELLLFQLKIL